MLVVGLISGTSADGTDVAVVEINGAPPALRHELLHFVTVPHPEALRQAILDGMHPQTGTVNELCALNVVLGEQFARAALTGINEAGLRPGQIDLIGSHGQTVWHDPDGPSPGTLQLGEAAVIIERTSIPVVNNFRTRDMAAGGQGAPLVAYPDVLLLTHPTKIRAAQNIGGIGNVTFLPPHNRPDLSPFAFDTGPGNVLIDQAAAMATDGAWTFDRDGTLAAQGQVDDDLLAWLLDLPYLKQRPPKTTGRELFTSEFARRIWQKGQRSGLQPEDIVATLTAHTARSIALAYQDFLPHFPGEVILSGGGAHNKELVSMLAGVLAPARLLISDEAGIPSDAKEALAFAILAYETWHGRPGNLPSATGADRQVVLGQIVR